MIIKDLEILLNEAGLLRYILYKEDEEKMAKYNELVSLLENDSTAFNIEALRVFVEKNMEKFDE